MLRSVLRVASLKIATPSTVSSMSCGAVMGSRMIHYSMSSSASGAQFQKLQPIRFYSAAAASNLTKDDVLTRVKDVIKTFKKNADAETVNLETAFNKDLGLDSLDTVELLVAVEEEFEIEIPDKVADNLKTVGETVEYILSNPESN